jgi:dUTP pyrophosphatase
MLLKFLRLNREAIIPKYAHPGDAGMDLYSLETHVLKPLERHEFALGFAIELPKGFVALIWDKSGLAFKQGLHVLGGVVDATFRGECKVSLVNLNKKSYKIQKGDKIAQLLIQPIAQATIKEVNILTNSKRGVGGFGSTGRR